MARQETSIIERRSITFQKHVQAHASVVLNVEDQITPGWGLIDETLCYPIEDVCWRCPMSGTILVTSCVCSPSLHRSRSEAVLGFAFIRL
ncbi:hypothetical protein Taro_018424 [Colocasia esculenta]|uniref:Uncharacterized protein n=1 Tax=Colocasia esculenta TaxID=4460 RepID=A0A843URD1_COLES|nr:hypothetical protein [Colocasia esculenta]